MMRQLQCPEYNRLKSASAGRSNKAASNRRGYNLPDEPVTALAAKGGEIAN